jgi:very-short-patch-repair endonuclease
MAAVLWSRGAAAGVAAGRLLDLPNCDDAPLEIITAKGRPMPHSGVIVHFTKRLPREQIIGVRNIPTTCVERTLLSLGAQWPRRKVAVAMDDAFRRGLTDSDRIDEFLRRTARRGRNGVRMVRELAKQRRVAGQMPERGLESQIWQLILDEGLPIPQRQVPILGVDGRYVRRVDFFYPPDLVIEGQSKKWHTGLFAEEYDADWQNALQEEGYRILLLTHKHVTAEREATARLIRRMLPSPVLFA